MPADGLHVFIHSFRSVCMVPLNEAEWHCAIQR